MLAPVINSVIKMIMAAASFVRRHAAAPTSNRGRLIAPARFLVVSSVVRGFIKQYAKGAFDPAVTSILEDAFEDAWRRVVASDAPYYHQEYVAAGRAILATHVISAAKAGERDPRWLADSALLYVSQQKINRTPPQL